MREADIFVSAQPTLVVMAGLPFPDGRNFAGSNPDVVHEMTKLHLRKLAAVATTAGLAFYANAAIARDVWLTLNGDSASRRVVINYGHPDDRPPPFADKVLDLVAIKSDGKKSLLKTSED